MKKKKFILYNLLIIASILLFFNGGCNEDEAHIKKDFTVRDGYYLLGVQQDTTKCCLAACLQMLLYQESKFLNYYNSSAFYNFQDKIYEIYNSDPNIYTSYPPNTTINKYIPISINAFRVLIYNFINKYFPYENDSRYTAYYQGGFSEYYHFGRLFTQMKRTNQGIIGVVDKKKFYNDPTTSGEHALYLWGYQYDSYYSIDSINSSSYGEYQDYILLIYFYNPWGGTGIKQAEPDDFDYYMLGYTRQ